MNGGPSQVDTFDPKPALATYQGQRPASIANLRTEYSTAGSAASVLPVFFRGAQQVADQRAVHGSRPARGRPLRHQFDAHEYPEPRAVHVHDEQRDVFVRAASYGSWLLNGLGTENQNLPGFVVLSAGFPVNGAANWSNRFLPGIYQGCHLNLATNFNPRRHLKPRERPFVCATHSARQLDERPAP